jgi:hypothetical protein
MLFKYEYIKQYIDLIYHSEKYDEQREQLHQEIIDIYFKNKTPNDKEHSLRLIFTAGCYGAGKSNVMKYLEKHGKINLNDYVYVDQDKIRPFIPEYLSYLSENSYTAGFKTNKETSYLAEFIQKHALFNNYNVIVDGSLRDWKWYITYIEWIKQMFPLYEIVIIFVEAEYINVLERSLKRGEETKRCIPLSCIKESYVQSPISYEILKDYVHKHYKINNDTEENKLINIQDINFL